MTATQILLVGNIVLWSLWAIGLLVLRHFPNGRP